jgi:ribose 5-phosphate isomerase B
MKIAIGNDHGGLAFKGDILALLQEMGVEVEDCGCNTTESVDYPDFAALVCDAVVEKRCDRGLLICGTGLGMSMAANRRPAIRAALCHEQFTARMSREHNNANVLCLGGRVVGPSLAVEIVRTWITTDFAGGRHQKRIDKFSAGR